MLVDTKARIGVFSIALGAYLPQFPSLVPEFEAQYDAFKQTLPDTVEIVDGGMVTTKELAQAAGDKFRAADVDLVILQLLTYATSYNMLPAVRDLEEESTGLCEYGYGNMAGRIVCLRSCRRDGSGSGTRRETPCRYYRRSGRRRSQGAG